MKKKLWFKAKNYGWGWTPISWQGWAVTIVCTFLIGYSIARESVLSDTPSAALVGFSPQVIILIAILLFVCYKKGEKPSWRWGNKKK